MIEQYYTPEIELKIRQDKLKWALEASGIDIALIFYKTNLLYFTGTIQNGILILPVVGEPFFAVKKSLKRAKMESPMANIVGFQSFSDLKNLINNISLEKFKSVGLEMEVIPASIYLRLLNLFPQAKIHDIGTIIRRIRMIKSSWEIEQMRKAAAISCLVHNEIPNILKAGISELALAAEIEHLFRLYGHQGVVRLYRFNQELYFGCVSSGSNASYPTYFDGPVGVQGLYPASPLMAGRKIINPSEPVICDLVSGFNGYCVDMSRTYAIGDLDKKFVQAYDFCLQMRSEIFNRLKPDKKCDEIYVEVMEQASRSQFANGFMGYDENKCKFLAHGVGLELDELPVIAQGFDLPLEPGMTIAVEPKTFFTDGGVGIEDTVLITKDGYQLLTEHSPDLVIVH